MDESGENLCYNFKYMSISRGVASFTLDHGKCPRWLFERMVTLGRYMVDAIVEEEGPDEFIKRVSDPVWFQSLGTVLAFDWNASGLTTVLTGALKEAIREREEELGIFIAGGKGKTSLKTPEDILAWGEKASLPPDLSNNLVYNSRMSAKVDSSLVQDGFQIYHHTFFFSKNGAWTVVQQGMNEEKGTARRYHWHSKNATDFINDPHTGIASQQMRLPSLDLSASESAENRDISRELVSENSFQGLMRDIKLLSRYSSSLNSMARFEGKGGQLTLVNLEDKEFKSHPVVAEDFSKNKYLHKILWQLTEEKPRNYETLLATKGVGPKTMRALSLTAEVLYGAKPSYEDPARFSFAHGGKDSTPYPVDTSVYDSTITTMRRYVQHSKLQSTEKDKILKKL